MINYDWNCKTVDVYLDKDDHTNVVYLVHWLVIGEDVETGIKVKNIGVQPLETEDIVDFVSFEELTNETLISWTKEAMGEEQVVSIEANIALQIEDLITPKFMTITIA